jgi:ATP-dependent exoDNAse (exonuclease V) alpha subunit
VTTLEHFKRELEMILWAEEGKGRGRALSSVGISDRLNPSQRKAVEQLLQCQDQFSVLYGIHGVGKTFSLSEVVRRNLEDGRNVIVLAPENGAREVLRTDAAKIFHDATADVFRRAENLDEFLVNPKLRKAFGKNDLVILDESSMASVEKINALMERARACGGRVLLAGDDGQLTSIEAGDGFRILLQKSGIHVSVLEEIIRQTPEALDGAYLRAAKLFGQRKDTEAFFELHKAGVIKERKGQNRIEAYADSIMRSLDGSEPAVVCNATHRENDAISDAVRRKRHELGQLTDERAIDAHRTLGWTTAQKKELDKIKPGQILEITRGKDKGRAWRVLEVADGKAVAEDQAGHRRVFTRAQAATIDVCEQRELKVAVGDHLLARAGTKNGIINGERFVVGGWDGEGNPVSTTGKSISMRNLTYGYAGTARKVEGMTNFKALFGADRRSIAHISRKVATVACTRGREAIELLVESIADLSQIQNRSGDRKAAVEMQIEPGALHPELRNLTARIEQTRAGQEAKEQVSAPEHHQVDLQAGKQVRQKQRAPAVPHHVIQQEMERRRQQERGIEYER